MHEASGRRLPKYVENEFRRYLACGLHSHGFARAVCETCGDELLLPFSCKRRGVPFGAGVTDYGPDTARAKNRLIWRTPP